MILCDLKCNGQGSISANPPHKMTEDTDQSRLVTFENNLQVGGPSRKAEMEVTLHLTLF